MPNEWLGPWCGFSSLNWLWGSRVMATSCGTCGEGKTVGSRAAHTRVPNGSAIVRKLNLRVRSCSVLNELVSIVLQSRVPYYRTRASSLVGFAVRDSRHNPD